ncbi:ornithine cyclodeaminase [Streptomyces sp. TRM S81-3]|uniref:Ornithine cyclodeaminase n=1 Tax=Streptomyces griseicoloratus TaxID=2752516 RepID=A0A926L5H2_9ACTN|nr:ornithine cyclodeaminase [Streptomyces griseicoloratus]MBD0420468.1 ornithine cyclodeaminase [Streptomyces griseicoloratus]
MHTQPRPMRYLDGATVASLCARIDPLETVTEAFLAVRANRSGVATEAALRWTAPDGAAARSLVLPAWHDGTYGCKIINASLGNTDRGLPRAAGLILLYDSQTAEPVCVMEGAQISALRTAAVSVAALRAVRPLPTVDRVALLGCGRQARTHLELLAAHGAVKSVIAYDLSPSRREAFADELRTALPHIDVETAADPEPAVRSAPVTVAATTTTTAYVPLDWLPEGSVFLNVSLDDAAEDVLLGVEHLFVDDWHLVSEDETRLLGRLARAGRATAPGTHVPGARQVDADLATLLSGAYPRPVTPTDRTVINPFGMGVHDVALATRVHALACAEDTGVFLPR